MERGTRTRLPRWLLATIALSVLAVAAHDLLQARTLSRSAPGAPAMASHWLLDAAGPPGIAPGEGFRLDRFRQVTTASPLTPADALYDRNLSRPSWHKEVSGWSRRLFGIWGRVGDRAPPADQLS